jgi:2'-5' RNA ligase/GNAT superfamily N-acetyltransferase
MARQRIGVVLLVPQPLATEVDGVRRALGDGALGRIEPHVTLIPPVNVHERDLLDVHELVRMTAAGAAPLHLGLGPLTTFAPVNPVAYLAVKGEPDQLQALAELHQSLRKGPLERPDEHPFVPHVTVAEDMPASRIEASLLALSAFDADVVFDRVHILAEQPGRIWVPIADAPLGERPRVVGRGSLPLELAFSGRPDLESAAVLAVESDPAGSPFAVSARSEGVVVAAAWGWSIGDRLEVADFVVVEARRGQGIGAHLLAAIEALAWRRHCSRAGISAPTDGAAASLLRGAGWEPVSPAVVGRPGSLAWWERGIPLEPD